MYISNLEGCFFFNKSDSYEYELHDLASGFIIYCTYHDSLKRERLCTARIKCLYFEQNTNSLKYKESFILYNDLFHIYIEVHILKFLGLI